LKNSFSKFFLLITISLFSACDELLVPALNLCNTQHPTSECFLPIFSVDDVELSNYNDYTIRIDFSAIPDSLKNTGSYYSDGNSIILFREINSIYDTLMFSISQDFDVLLDTTTIYEGNYNYSFSFQNVNGNSSKTDIIQLEHSLPVLNSLQQISNEDDCTAIFLEWSLNLQEYFSLEYLDLLDTVNFNFQLMKTSDSIVVDEGILENKYENINSYSYSFSNFQPEENYYFKVGYRPFTNSSNNLEINFDEIILLNNLELPEKVDFFDWTPISSNIIKLEWNMGEGLFNNIQLVRNLRDIETLIMDDISIDKSFVLIDTIGLNNDNVFAGERVDYYLRWSCGETERETSITTSTFPIYNMVYIPPFNDFQFKRNDNFIDNGESSINSFYIDTYEVDTDLYENPSRNEVIDATQYFPIDNISYNDALAWIQARNVIINSEFPNCNSQIDAEFHLPSQEEWQIAAGYTYSIENDEFSLSDYPIYGFYNSSIPNCEFINFFSCHDDGPQYNPYLVEILYNENARSYFGIFNSSGNVKEWVEAGNEDYYSLMGGSFLEEIYNTKSSTVMFEIDPNRSHFSYGIRSALSIDFLNEWKNCVEN
jgi:hypothetical protein